ncbi:biotin--[acetyl-CoA-carboxylase] ligase [Candidatus Woesearchaeota archaeon]|nr:biotin--[acetyl-CoA-carboxylase] ligase [Candidatus Woesearchaeota archaeon]
MPIYKIHHFKSLTSTQDKAKEFSGNGMFNAVVISDKQTKGRGRFKRKWHSGKGGLWMSILLKPDDIQNLQYLTFIAAISVAESIKEIAKLNTNIKWPNDVHYKGKKLCGILTEGVFGKENFVVVGIGLNVNQKDFSDDIKDIATSLRIIKNKNYDTKLLMQGIVDVFFNLYYNHYNKNKFNNILKIWRKYCDTIGKNVVVITKTEKLKGKAIGVDEDCNLLLKLKNNKITKITEGDIKVRYSRLTK